MSSSSPASRFGAVTASNTVNFSMGECRALYIGTGGDVTAVSSDGTAVLFSNTSSGTILPVECVRVNATGTTASGIVALY